MKSSTQDQVEGKLHEVKGTVKEAVGKAIKSPDMTSSGQTEKVAGTVQKKIGQVKKVFEK